jgi:RimJ/RimL family protein N-acetyltransferase
MLRGKRVGLRAIAEGDLPALLAIRSDVETAMAASGGPWRPMSLAESTAALAKREAEPPSDKVYFAVEELATGELAGDAQLWGIDTHNRCAHLGFSLLPGARGRGLGSDTVRTLCDYGFRVRGMHRLQLETNASNAAARAVAVANGFVLEGQLRGYWWVAGEFVDEAVYGLLADEWRARA